MSFTDRLNQVVAAPDRAPDEDERAVPAGRWGVVLLLTLLFALAYSYLAVMRNRTYHTGAYDLSLFSQAVDHLAHLQAPTSSIKGYAEGGGPGFDLWGDHSHYVIALWAPLWRLYPHPVTLLVQQAVLVAAALPAVWLVAWRRLGGPVAPWVALLAAGLAWGVGSAIGFDVHEVAFELPLLAWGVERGLAGRWRASTVLVLLLLLCKEDTGPTVVALGIWMALLGRRALGAAVAAAGVAGFLLTTKVLIPAVSGHDYAYWSYDSLGPDPLGVLKTFVTHPLYSLKHLVDSGTKQRTLEALLLPAGLLALASPLLIVVLPLILARMLSDSHSLWTTSFHYSALPCLVLVLAAVDGLARYRARLGPRRPRVARYLPVIGLVALLGQTAGVSVTLADGFRSVAPFPGALAADRRAAYDGAVAAVPAGVAVTASSSFVPHLLDRCPRLCDVRLLQIVDGAATGPNGLRALPQPFPEPATDWVLLDTTVKQYPDVSVGLTQSYAGILLTRGWTVVYDTGGVEVLRSGAGR